MLILFVPEGLFWVEDQPIAELTWGSAFVIILMSTATINDVDGVASKKWLQKEWQVHAVSGKGVGERFSDLLWQCVVSPDWSMSWRLS